ncbi:MAG: sensor histidine kinase, partial [Ginsengibacter sp.]
AKFIQLIEGREENLQAEAREQMLLVGAELLRNAFIHAQPSEVRLVVACKRRQLILSVQDNGCGIDAAILSAGGCSGHWGLTGIRERAASLKSKVTFRSVPGSTIVTLTVPAAVAYRLDN